jgi:hypothetical protein
MAWYEEPPYFTSFDATSIRLLNNNLLMVLGGPEGGSLATLVDVTEQILDTLNVTNNLVSIKEFAYTASDNTAFTKYNAWITANPDWHILNEIQYPNPDITEGINGTPIIMIRYTGEKTSD